MVRLKIVYGLVAGIVALWHTETVARFATEIRQTLCLTATTKLLGAEGASMRYKTMSIQEILAYVNTRYTYDRKTGRFYHAIRSHGTPRKVGAEAGSTSKSNNCYLIYVAGANVARYRLVWMIEHGAWPPGYIQHLDGNKFNDHISNLALARDFLPAGKIKQDRRPKKDEPVKMPAGITFMERRGQYRVDIPGRPPQYFDSLSQAQGAL